MPGSPELALSVQVADGSPPCPVARARLRRWARAALRCDARLTIRFVGAREGRALNKAYRARDYATNVLTFAYEDTPPGVRAPARRGSAQAAPVSADIVICLPVVQREARAQRKPCEHHLAHLVIHGVLHAQGFEHDDQAQAEAMEALEVALLRRFRVPDPYAGERAGRAGTTPRPIARSR